MTKKTDSLLFKFALTIAVFTLIMLISSAVLTYINQTNIYKKQCLENTRRLDEYLESIMSSDSDILYYVDYYMSHYRDVKMDWDFDEYTTARMNFESIFAREYPGKTLGRDIELDELSDEVQEAFFIYNHQYFVLTFEEARESFGMSYVYFLVMGDERARTEKMISEGKNPEYNVLYLIDGERTEETVTDENGNETGTGYLYLGDTYFNDYDEEHRIEWDTWTSGEKLDEFQEWDNAWGHTYACYTPLIVEGRKIGLIVSEIDVDEFSRELLRITLIQTASIAAVLIVLIVIIIVLINKYYISKVVNLEAHVREYADEKDVRVAEEIRRNICGRNELTSLAENISDMIFELDRHMLMIVSSEKELNAARARAEAMNRLANRDALTGIRNKTAYDNEVKRLERAVSDGYRDFGIAMIDLNFLKRINDTYGHEQGNIAIKKLCGIICLTFKRSPVFRVGGDEFVAVIEREDYTNVNNLVNKFNSTIMEIGADSSLDEWERVSAAIGVALYDPAIDDSIASVFKRADKAMYEHKKSMKAARE